MTTVIGVIAVSGVTTLCTRYRMNGVICVSTVSGVNTLSAAYGVSGVSTEAANVRTDPPQSADLVPVRTTRPVLRRVLDGSRNL